VRPKGGSGHQFGRSSTAIKSKTPLYMSVFMSVFMSVYMYMIVSVSLSLTVDYELFYTRPIVYREL